MADLEGATFTVEFPECGNAVVLTYDNSLLFTFVGKHAMYDHVLVQCEVIVDDTDPDEVVEEMPYHYIFANEDNFAVMRAFIIANSFRQFLNAPRASEDVIQEFDEKALATIAESFGDSFELSPDD